MSRLGVRGIAGFNEKIAVARASGEFIFNPFSLTPEDPEPLKHFTHIVLVVDELADLLMVVGKKIEEPLARLAQKSRACGIHLILATQRPSADVLTGLIRSNVPARIAFQVSSKTDSRIILDQMGADALLGNGDMLYLPKGSIPVRVHGAFVSDEEVVRVANMLRELGAPDYIEGILDGEEEDTNTAESADSDAEQDALYDKAVEIVLTTKKASISNVQRQLRVGYQRAARMIDAMENAGLISAPEHNGNRTVLAKNRSL
jgi:S-DNA-T family DNA segregation ATPase FtsK/SpoIIIE